MQFFRKIGGLLGRHYEKVLVAVALVGLIYAVYHLWSKKQSEEETIQTYNRNIQKKATQGIPSVDLASLKSALEAAKHPPTLDLGLPHNLFNPVKWQRRPDGSILKIERGTEVGPAALKLVGTAPLRTIISIDRPSAGGLFMYAQQEASTNAGFRRRIQGFVTTNSAHLTRLFTLREIRGTPEKPEAVVELAGGERQVVTVDQPFSRVDGYKADLQYPPDQKTFNDRRVGDVLNLAGEDYIIVAINPNEIVVSARSNNRRTTIRNNAAP